MINNNKDKRLVLIGISRKGERGFKKQVDSEIESDLVSIAEEPISIPLQKLTNSGQILNLLTE